MRTSLRFITPFLRSTLALSSDLPDSPATDAWAKLGPESGYMTDVAIDPVDPDILYAGTNGEGIYRYRPAARRP